MHTPLRRGFVWQSFTDQRPFQSPSSALPFSLIRHRALADCDGAADRRRRGPEHARADRNDASTAKVGADSGTGHAGNARGSAGSRELPYAERVLRWADDFTLFRLYGDLLGAIA